MDHGHAVAHVCYRRPSEKSAEKSAAFFTGNPKIRFLQETGSSNGYSDALLMHLIRHVFQSFFCGHRGLSGRMEE